MEFSEKWLREWVNPMVSSTVLCEQITESGLEVEDIRVASDVFHGVIIGEVLSSIVHPNSHQWNIITVDIGAGEEINIISKIFNINIGIKIAIAPVGAILPDNVIIKEIKIEGHISQGVLCSFFELGIFEYKDNIIIFPPDVTVGTDVKKYFLLDDNIIKISVTPNRFDCLSILGIARELAVKNNMSLPRTIVKPVISVINNVFSIILKEPHIFPRYFCRVIKNISQDVQLPISIKEKLRRSNISMGNIVIDIIHYVSLELGLPLHVFNADCITGNIILRISNSNKDVTVVNGSSFNISKNMFLISDDHKVLSIGGNINTDISAVTSGTKNLFIGSVFFNIDRKSKRDINYGEKNNITNIYEYGIDPNIQEYAIEYATNLLIDIVGGSPGPLTYKIDDANFFIPDTIKLYKNTIKKILGFFIEDELVSKILSQLGFQVICNFTFWKIQPPSWRFDIKREEDIVGELIRIYGYNKIPSIPYISGMTVNKYSNTEYALKRVKNLLIYKGFYEIITYSFVDPDIQNMLFPDKKKLFLSNPISQEMSSMRVSLWPGLLSTLFYNQCRQQEHICLFESGLCFIEDKHQQICVKQNLYLAGIAQGYIYNNKCWDSRDKKIDFYDVKGILESILEINGKLKSIDFRIGNLSCLHPGKSAAIYYFGNLIGHIGVLHPSLEKKLKLNSSVILFEILWNDIFNDTIIKTKKISYLPNSKRDISIIVSEDILVGDIIQECKNIDSKKIIEVYVFDIYYGSGMQKGEKSLGIRFIFEDNMKTLEEHDIVLIISRCISVLKKKFKIIMRDTIYGIN